LQAFYAPPHHQETPAFVAGHVVQGKPGQRRQGHHQAVEKIQQLAKVRRFTFQLHGFALQLHQGLPVLAGQLATHLGRRPLQALQVGAQARWPVIAEQRCEQTLRQFALFRQQAQVFAQLHRRQQRQGIVAVDITRQHNSQPARAVIAALAVTAKPEQVFHHPRRQIRIAAHQVMGTNRALGTPLLTTGGAFAEHPGVFARTAALHRHHFGIGFSSHTGQAPG